MREFAAPGSHWMIDAIGPAAAASACSSWRPGWARPGMLAAELVAPLGGVIVSDQAEAMLDGARARAIALGLTNVEFQVLNAEWIDLPLASVDVVLCRWGYMLMADPAAALGETRRVLRPGGRLALAVWDSHRAEPVGARPAQVLIERGLARRPTRGEAPGPFALGAAWRVHELLEQAGFAEIDVEALELTPPPPRLRAFWELTLDLSPQLPRRRPLPPAAGDRGDPARAGRALRPLHRRRRQLAVPARTLLAARECLRRRSPEQLG